MNSLRFHLLVFAFGSGGQGKTILTELILPDVSTIFNKLMQYLHPFHLNLNLNLNLIYLPLAACVCVFMYTHTTYIIGAHSHTHTHTPIGLSGHYGSVRFAVGEKSYEMILISVIERLLD